MSRSSHRPRPRSRRLLGGTWTRGARCRVSARPPNRSTACAARTPRSTGSTFGWPPGGVEAGEPQQVVEQPAHALRLAVDPPEGRPVPGGVAILREREARVRLDDRERRPQLVRGVGGELELALAGRLDRRGDAPADGDRAEEHDDEQDRRDEQLGQDERGLGVGDGSSVWPTTTWSSPAGRAGDPHVDAVDRGRDGRVTVAYVGRQARVRGRRDGRVPSSGSSRRGAARRTAGSGRRRERSRRRSRRPAGLGWLTRAVERRRPAGRSGRSGCCVTNAKTATAMIEVDDRPRAPWPPARPGSTAPDPGRGPRQLPPGGSRRRGRSRCGRPRRAAWPAAG